MNFTLQQSERIRSAQCLHASDACLRVHSQLMALPNLPASHIPTAFNSLRDRCPQSNSAQKLQELLQYLEKTWIAITSCPTSAWSTFKRAVRTNNDPEGWHNCLNQNAPSDKMNLYLLITSLHEETKLLPTQMKLVSQKKLYKRQSKKQDSKLQKPKQLWTAYEDHNIITSDYLKQYSSLADHAED